MPFSGACTTAAGAAHLLLVLHPLITMVRTAVLVVTAIATEAVITTRMTFTAPRPTAATTAAAPPHRHKTRHPLEGRWRDSSRRVDCTRLL